MVGPDTFRIKNHSGQILQPSVQLHDNHMPSVTCRLSCDSIT
jgi:hypothetical protein